MKSTSLLAGIILSLIATQAASAQVTEAQITQPTVEVRSGPSEKYYVTSILTKGESVKIVGKKNGGWLAIAPPGQTYPFRARSFSWVNAADVSAPQGSTVVVTADSTMLRVGTATEKDQPPTTQWFAAAKGRPLTVITDENKQPMVMKHRAETLIAILPIETEYRFIPSDAIDTSNRTSMNEPATPNLGQAATASEPTAPIMPRIESRPVQPSEAAAPQPRMMAIPTSYVGSTGSGTSTTSASTSPGMLDQDWQLAVRMESRDPRKSIELYENVARRYAQSDPATAIRALNRSQYWRNYVLGGSKPSASIPAESGAGYTGTVTQEVQPQSTVISRSQARPMDGDSAAATTSSVQVPAGATAQPIKEPATTSPSVQQSAKLAAPLTGNELNKDKPHPEWYGPGVLKRTLVPDLDGKKVYRLDPLDGRPPMYTTSQPGVNLSEHIGQTVSLYGPFGVHRELFRQYYMEVNKVHVYPPQ